MYQVGGSVAKPSLEEAPSGLATVGRYVLAADIWPLLERTPPGAGGEIQLTDCSNEGQIDVFIPYSDSMEGPAAYLRNTT